MQRDGKLETRTIVQRGNRTRLSGKCMVKKARATEIEKNAAKIIAKNASANFSLLSDT